MRRLQFPLILLLCNYACAAPSHFSKLSKQKATASVQITCVSEDDHLMCSDQREIIDQDLKKEQLTPVENEAGALATVYIDCSHVADALPAGHAQQAVVYWHETIGSVKHKLSNSFPYQFEGKRNERLKFKTVFDNDQDVKPKMTRFVCEACPLGVLSGGAACIQDTVDFDLLCNLPAVDTGKSHDPGKIRQFTTIFHIGTDHVCLSENPHDTAALLNNRPVFPGMTSMSFICQQDPYIPLEGHNAVLKLNDEVIAKNGERAKSSLCKDPSDDQQCNVFFDGEKYLLGPIDNDNIDQFLGDYMCTVSHPEVTYTDSAVTNVARCANTPMVEHGDAQDQGIKRQFSTGFTIGTLLICLSQNKDGDEILINNSPSILGYSALSIICQQEKTVPLENTVAELYFNDEVIGINGEVQYSLLCEDPKDDSKCNVHFYEDGYVLGPITNDNYKQFLGTLLCKVAHADVDYTSEADTTIAECMNVPTIDVGAAHHHGTPDQFYYTFKIGTNYIWLSTDPDNNDVLINTKPPIVSGRSAVAIVCQQDPAIPLDAAELVLSLDNEVIGINGVIKQSSLCEDPTDAEHCSIVYYDNKYVLDKITKDNMKIFEGEYTCTAGHRDLDYTKMSTTVISVCLM